MISKNQIKRRTKKKTNSELVDTIKLAKNKGLLDLGEKLSAPRRFQKRINIEELNKIKKDKVLVIGRVLSDGDISKKMSIFALGFSKQAKKKLEKAGCKIGTIKQEIERNNKLDNVEII